MKRAAEAAEFTSTKVAHEPGRWSRSAMPRLSRRLVAPSYALPMAVYPGKRCLRAIERCGRLGHTAERAGTITFLMIAGLVPDLIASADLGKSFGVADFDRLQWISSRGAGSPARRDRRRVSAPKARSPELEGIVAAGAFETTLDRQLSSWQFEVEVRSLANRRYAV